MGIWKRTAVPLAGRWRLGFAAGLRKAAGGGVPGGTASADLSNQKRLCHRVLVGAAARGNLKWLTGCRRVEVWGLGRWHQSALTGQRRRSRSPWRKVSTLKPGGQSPWRPGASGPWQGAWTRLATLAAMAVPALDPLSECQSREVHWDPYPSPPSLVSAFLRLDEAGLGQAFSAWMGYRKFRAYLLSKDLFRLHLNGEHKSHFPFLKTVALNPWPRYLF